MGSCWRCGAGRVCDGAVWVGWSYAAMVVWRGVEVLCWLCVLVVVFAVFGVDVGGYEDAEFVEDDHGCADDELGDHVG